MPSETAEIDIRLKQLRKQRSTVKGQLTKLSKWLDEPDQHRDVFEVESRLEMLTTYMHQYENLQSQLELLDEKEEADRDVVDTQVTTLKAKLKRLQHELGADRSAEMSLDTSVSSNPANIQVQMMPNVDVPLPKLTKFSGENYLDYPNFINQFKALVDTQNVRGYTKIRKFCILRSVLEGRALEAIDHLVMTNANYDEALKILKDRFYKPNLIFESLIKRLVELPKVYEAGKSLRKLIDHINSNLKALEGIEATPEQIGYGILIHTVLRQVDDDTLNKWEEHACQQPESFPNWKDLMEFLEKRANILESISFLQRDKRVKDKNNPVKKTYAAMSGSCECCFKSCSSIIHCATFLAKPPTERYSWAKENKYCIRCLLKMPHNKCEVEKCTKCERKHNTLLHFEGTAEDNNKADKGVNGEHTTGIQSLNVTRTNSSGTRTQVLGTAIVKVKTRDGSWVPARALIDGGSMTHFITKRLVSKLKLKLNKSSTPVMGLFGGQEIKSAVGVTIKSTVSGYEDTLETLVLPEFNHHHPATKLNKDNLKIPSNIPLADPTFDCPQRIDLLIGVGLAYKMLMIGQVSLSSTLLLQKTQFGWIVAGEVNSDAFTPNKLSLFSGESLPVQENSDKLIQKFWEIDSVPRVGNNWSPTEVFCEDHFIQNTIRNEAGRFIVKLPFSRDPTELGESETMARRRLYSVQKRLVNDKEMHRLYHAFMTEYEQLGHMKPVTLPPGSKAIILPHHGVLKLDSTSTKLRVVFDASAATTSGLSLNDIMPHGPTIQPTLFLILIDFRFYKYGLSGDITKMYRQIEVHPDDRLYQCILWQRLTDSQPTLFALNTVTYGTSSAPFLATRCLLELANTETGFPLASLALQNHTYVDNTLFGADTPGEVMQIRKQLDEILAKAGMEMRKWCSNSPEVMESIPVTDQETLTKISDDEVIKTLGLYWNPSDDSFVFTFTAPEDVDKWTKRKIVSYVAKIFDPLGFVAPVVTRLKIFIQNLWLLKLNWDESLTQEALTTWQRLYKDLHLMGEIKIPRYVFYDAAEVIDYQLHGFADASGQAYGAVLYVRCTLKNGAIASKLLCSKSRVAPLKKITLPRLELLGALLLSEVVELVWPCLKQKVSKVYCWLDAQVALTWVTQSPHKYSDFIANRITIIQEKTKNCIWRHVPGTLNPADILSRGASPATLSTLSSWFTGPEFLCKAENEWIFPKEAVIDESDERLEAKRTSLSLYTRTVPDLVQTYKYHGTLYRIQKTFGYVARILEVLKTPHAIPNTLKLTRHSEICKGVRPPNDKIELSPTELENGLLLAVRIAQAHHLYTEYHLLKRDKQLPVNSSIMKLAPFMDTNGLIRVGGRLDEAVDLTFDEKHPIIIPKNHPITDALLFFYHWKGEHAGPLTMLTAVRRKFWPIGGKVVANKIYRNCPICTRYSRKIFKQVMGNLPKTRVTEFKRCFEVVGIDLFGPFTTKHQGRGSPRTDTYMMMIVCFATRAIQIQYVDGATTESVINALIRFMSRSGRPRLIYSDNAQNFRGADNVFQLIKWNKIDEWCRTENRVQWKFIPARSPHWGGLWETQIRLAKRQLMKVMQGKILHLDVLITLMSKIEAVLNNRPLTPLSINPKDGQPLTAADCLIGGPIITLPDPDPTDFPQSKRNMIKTWLVLCEIRQHWWNRWKAEVRQHFQQRHKWHTGSKNIRVGKIVLITNNEHPYAWEAATISQIFPGRDGRARAVEVTTNKDQRKFKRAVTELVPIPQDDDVPE